MKPRGAGWAIRLGFVCALVVASAAVSDAYVFLVYGGLVSIPAFGTSGPGNPYPYSPPPVPVTAPGVITTVSVSIYNFTHTFPDDVDIVLVGPTGRAFVLMSDVGGNFDVNSVSIQFRDDADAFLPDNAQLVGGAFKPTNYLSGDDFPSPGPGTTFASPAPVGTATLSGTFAGTSPVGTWHLFVVDDAMNDVGEIGDWNVRFSTAPPVLDHDTDGIADFVLVRDTGGGSITWFMLNSTGFSAVQWGTTADFFLSGDYDGDRKSDITVWRQNIGTFYVRRSSDGALLPQPWGLPSDNARVPGDYDGDGRTDFAAWRGTDGTFYVWKSSTWSLFALPFGLNQDYPVANFLVTF